ncbi:hypothetical protein AVL62_02140 [Serinicoccus chungangensis]|uniref:DUF5129 domain-containing protein n=1 Tax=Serinicoccus chungangensis TaxID=767452 RepID=A0A0W8I5V8_9MICO|nr:DUF5129 domain-containing protein [Serinicoccus chungangensis]KUG53604.1 hypothetical protein AVL62_02140 [Serinicoccus chungangensis]
MSNVHRAVVGGVALLGVVGTSVGLWATQTPEHAAGSLVVDDGAQVLDLPALEAGVEGLRFHEPTDVAVYSTLGGEAAQTDDLALNTAVLEHARAERTEWLSADGQTWADDLFIFAVDPEGRLVGTYFGENREVPQEEQLEIQDAAKDDFRAADWTDGTLAGLEAGAARIEQPFMRSAGGVVLAGLLSLLTAVGAGTWLGIGVHRARVSRDMRAEGDRRMASVVGEMDATELHARLIPEDSRYGGRVLRRYDEFTRGVRELTDLGNEVRAIPESAYNRKASQTRLTAYRDKALELDHLDDVIADTATFLGRDRAWAQAWTRQEAPLREDLEQVGSVIETDVPDEARGLPQVAELREFASGALARLDQLRGQLEAQEVSPDDALDELRTTRDGLSERLDRLAGAVAEEVGKTPEERVAMKKAMRDERSQRRTEATILAAAYPSWGWYPLGAFQTGLHSGTAAVEQSRSSSSGATSGYSGGGGFSGAGSSSRF